MVEVEIGDSSDYTVFIGDGAPGSSVYGMYFKPDGVKMGVQLPATIQKLYDLDNTQIEQLGKIAVIMKLKNIIIDNFTDLQNFLKAMVYWGTGAGATRTFGGHLLTFIAKDVNDNLWAKIGDWNDYSTLDTLGVKIIKPWDLEPLPSGKWLIRYMEAIRVKPSADVVDA